MNIYSSGRKFVVFSYDIGHGELLLRSEDLNVARSDRVDILFKDVIALECRVRFDGLILREEGLNFLEKQKSKPGAIMEPGHQIYSISSKGWDGFIVAGKVFVHNDQQDFFESSPLWQR